MQKPTILLVAAEGDPYREVPEWLRCQGYKVFAVSHLGGGLRAWRHRPCDLVLIGASPPSAGEAVALAQQLRHQCRSVPILLLTTHSTEELAIAALRAGVTDYVRLPTEEADLLTRVRCYLADISSRERRSACPAAAPMAVDGACLIGQSAPMQAIKATIQQVASTDSHVLITGETGTGKELVAAFIHQHSSRQHKPLVYINCAALPESLVESELFGYERGAFTGAQASQAGLLRTTDGGTVVFDEIGDMSLYAQAKILRAIERREIQRLGGGRSLPLNIRILAATNQDLERCVAEGRFRADLFFRLNVICIHLPPLRDRQEDVLLLCQHFMGKLNHRFDRDVIGLTDETWDAFLRYPWPGNVRELKHLLEATFITLPPSTQTITLADLPDAFRQRLQDATALPADEPARVLAALSATKWNRSQAAKQLHCSRMTLYRKMAKYHICTTPPPRVPALHVVAAACRRTATPECTRAQRAHVERQFRRGPTGQ